MNKKELLKKKIRDSYKKTPADLLSDKLNSLGVSNSIEDKDAIDRSKIEERRKNIQALLAEQMGIKNERDGGSYNSKDVWDKYNTIAGREYEDIPDGEIMWFGKPEKIPIEDLGPYWVDEKLENAGFKIQEAPESPSIFEKIKKRLKGE